MAEADWEQVTYIGKRQPKGSQLKTEKVAQNDSFIILL